MQSGVFKNNNINVEVTGSEFVFHGLKSEFQQVILNIITNAKDALLQNNIKNPTIKINIDKENKTITISDNAGGIPKDIIDRVFEPYFTTKEQGKGTGIGLYMSKMIIEENMQGTLEVSNTNRGAKFSIILN